MKFLRKPINNVITTYEKFIQYEASAGIILLFVTILALVFSNSYLSDFYFSLWNTKFIIGFENFYLEKPLILWINDGLMAIFFLLVGLEIKREILVGELSQIKQAVLPIGAAIGGMVFPALCFFLLEIEALDGWAIPMATDIAFSLGILKLLGNRIPLSLKVFLTAFAIIDDIGAVIIIALFYTSNLNIILLAIALLIILLLILFNYWNITHLAFYLLPGIVLWLLFLKAGIHPTIAAVILAFTIPAKPKVEIMDFLSDLEYTKKIFENTTHREKEILLSHKQYDALEDLNTSIELVQSPIQKLEHRLHGLVSYFIMPLFAFSNAGVIIKPETFGNLSISISVSLVAGKLIGILLGTYLFMYIFKANLPENTTFKQMIGIGFLGGVGFTMSLFINNLAYTENLLLDQARIGILLGSSISGILGYFILLFSSKEINKV
ncbi:MAG: Na(+)/H(+) antiporter NhaA [Leptospiraceae bacterium]|nr:MAG: Na(+)/H(+) antiporter NhaA [Leptospiraceae bacterium]